VSREGRKSLIREIEDLRGSRVLTYVTADRVPAGAQMAPDAVRVVYDHLRHMGNVEQLDVFIYSRGGEINVPWRIASALRGTAKTWNLLVPLAANSAATLLALGADSVVLGPQAELGPIDPQLTEQPGTPTQLNVSVEDVMAYVKFVTERAGLSDQSALAAALAKLTERMDPVALGQIYRTHTHIREVAGQMLRSRKKPPSEQTTATIIETLAERVYAHGHAIGFKDANEMGLPVAAAGDELNRLQWELLNEYEAEMKMREPVDPFAVLDAGDSFEEEGTLAAVESTWGVHEFSGTLAITAQRQMPPQLAVNLNLNLQVPQPPPGAAPPNPQQMQQLIQAIQPQIAQVANDAVAEALKTQAPLTGFDIRFKGGQWKGTIDGNDSEQPTENAENDRAGS
jgi:hypothetical protein